MGVAIEYGKNAYEYLSSQRKRYGDVFTLLVAGKRMTFVLDPINVPLMFKGCKQLDFAPVAHEISAPTFDHPDFFDNKHLDDALHKLYVSKLQGASLVTLSERMHSKVYEFLFERGYVTPKSQQPASPKEGEEIWREGDLYQFVSECIFSAGTQTIFGDGFCSPQQLEALKNFIAFDSRFPLLVAGLPPFLLPKVGPARSFLRRLVKLRFPRESEIVECRRELFDQNGTEEALRLGLQVALLWASQGNTIPAAFWALAYIISDPAAQNAIREEYRRVAGSALGAPASELDLLDGEGKLRLDAALLRQLPVLDSAINESLRLCSSSIVIRRVMEDFTLLLASTDSRNKNASSSAHADESKEGTATPVTLRKYLLRKGDNVCLFPEIIHRDPEIYDNPNHYQFDRFVPRPHHAASSTPKFFKRGHELKYPLLPFGGGVSHCPGRLFAFNEIRLLVLLVLNHLRVRLLPSPADEPGGPARMPPTDPARVGLGILSPIAPLRFAYCQLR